MRTLYININGEEVQSTESIEVIGQKEDAIEDSFYIFLGTEILSGSRVGGVSQKNIIRDFQKESPDEFKEIEAQWNDLKEILLGDNPSGGYKIILPSEYLYWLRYSKYAEVYEKKFQGQKETTVTINLDELYEDSVDALRRKAVRVLDRDGNASTIDEFVVNDEFVTRKSKIVRDLKAIYADISFVSYEKFCESKAVIEAASNQDSTLKDGLLSVSKSTEPNIDKSYRYYAIHSFSCGYAIAQKANPKEGEYPFVCIDVGGNEVFKDYLFLSPFINGIAKVAKKFNGPIAFINIQGDVITPFKYYYPWYVFKTTEMYKLGLIVDNNDYYFLDKYIRVEDMNRHLGLLDYQGKEIIPCKSEYSYIYEEDNYIIAHIELEDEGYRNLHRYLFFGNDGKHYLSVDRESDDYDDNYLDVDSNGIFLEEFHDGKYVGIRNSKGEILLPAQFREIEGSQVSLNIC